MQDKQKQLHGKTDWFKIGKGVHQGCILHPAYLNYMQSTAYEMPGWENHKVKSRLLGEILISSDMQMIPLLWQKVTGSEESFDEGRRGE